MTPGPRTDVFVELHVPDLRAAKAFYRRFKFAVVREEAAKDGDGYLVMRRGSSLLFFWGGTKAVREHEYFRRFRSARKRGYGVELVIPVDDLDAAYRAAVAANCVVAEPQTRAWGSRDFRAEDPFGFYLRFTERHDPTRRSVRRPAARRPAIAPAGRGRRKP
jgi:catechol 2,3-dioxygenase-like lactoylglutathione lyase family enzyme